MSDDLADGNVNSGPQQQSIARNSHWGSGNEANWNMVFAEDVNDPAGAWPNPDYTFVSSVQDQPFRNQLDERMEGTSISISQLYIN